MSSGYVHQVWHSTHYVMHGVSAIGFTETTLTLVKLDWTHSRVMITNNLLIGKMLYTCRFCTSLITISCDSAVFGRCATVGYPST